jgi:hypothetical protein
MEAGRIHRSRIGAGGPPADAAALKPCIAGHPQACYDGEPPPCSIAR